jgi:hypothetical protein
MAFTLSASDSLDFTLTKRGGAKLSMRIAIFKDPKSAAPQRVRLLFMGSAPSLTEAQTLEALEPGDYQVVVVSVIEEALNGTYDYTADVCGKVLARRDGDVNESQTLDVESIVHRKNLTVTP